MGSMGTQKHGLNLAERPGIATSCLVALHRRGMTLRDTDSRAITPSTTARLDLVIVRLCNNSHFNLSVILHYLC